MALFTLSYDLRKQRDYQPLYDELKTLNAVRVLESLWAIERVGINCIGIRDYFKQFVDKDDGLFVAEVTDWATWRVIASPPN